MIIHLKVSFYNKEKHSVNAMIEDMPNLEFHQVLEYINQNKVDIIKQAGCTLSDDEIKKDLATGDAIVRIDYGK